MSKTALVIPVFLAAVAAAQTTPASQPTGGRSGGRGRGGPAVAAPLLALKSPEVHPDRTVTLRFRAPQASAVEVVGELTQKGLNAGVPMTKGEDGIWTVTIGPIPPEIWRYAFRVDGLPVVDPSNPAFDSVAPGIAVSSMVEVPGDAPAFYDARPVPHGEVRQVMYESKAMGVTRWVWIYTPPGYEHSTSRYPVLYLLHGNGESMSGWTWNGRANIILDNLIAEGRARPMIVVMPQGHAVQGARVGPLEFVPGETGMFSPRFPKDLLEDVMPLVERDYRVTADADHRAIAGLSMGGGQSLAIGMGHPDVFHYVLGYSAAVGGNFLDIDQNFQQAFAHPEELNKKLKLLWFAIGKQDFIYQGNKAFAEQLRARGVNFTFKETEGQHVWRVWRNYFHETAPLLFQGGK
jgi:enterochelin esterase-like enzyme